MTRYIPVANTSEIGPGEREVFEIEGLYIAVFNVGGTYYAIEDVCTHDNGPLADGDLEGFAITCPRHGAQFDIRTGAVLCMPAVTPVRRFDVRVESDTIQVDLDS